MVTCIFVFLMFFTACGKNDIQKEATIRGTWNENVYTNEFADISFKMPENWNYATDEEFANVMNIGEDFLGEEDKKLIKISELKVLHDIMAQDMYTGDNIIMMFENLTMSIGGSKLDEEKYADITKEQFKNMESIQYEIGETYDVTIGNNKCLALEVSVKDSNLTQICYFRKIGDYMFSIITTNTESMESNK